MPDAILEHLPKQEAGNDPVVDPIVRYAQLKSEYGIPYSRQHLTVLENQNKFPKRERFGPRFSGWRQSKILQYLAKRGWE
jgi:predicted DNA-binding transcriptional regulator AlpA